MRAKLFQSSLRLAHLDFHISPSYGAPRHLLRLGMLKVQHMCRIR
jgi:hypothetical protein